MCHLERRFGKFCPKCAILGNSTAKAQRSFPPWRLCAVASLRWFLRAKPKRENRAASVRVFRVFRGENASFLSLLRLFAAKSMEAPVLESLTLESGVFRGQTQSNPVKPSQTIFFTLTGKRRHAFCAFFGLKNFLGEGLGLSSLVAPAGQFWNHFPQFLTNFGD